MSNEDTNNCWRARDAEGTIHVLPTPERFGYIFRAGDACYRAMAKSARNAAVVFAAATINDLDEVKGPGELFLHEQVAVERERCASHTRNTRDQWKGRTERDHTARVIADRIEEASRSGESR